jgi:hypothetical protein
MQGEEQIEVTQGEEQAHKTKANAKKTHKWKGQKTFGFYIFVVSPSRIATLNFKPNPFSLFLPRP